MTSRIRGISTAELIGLKNEIEAGNCLLMDVRERHESESEHIPLSVLMPISEVDRRWKELDPSRRIVLYCRSGSRSARVAQFLASKGFSDIGILEGGLNRWERDHGPVERK